MTTRSLPRSPNLDQLKRQAKELPSSRDSQVILDEPGAERLLRNGDMLLMVEGKLTRLQGDYIDPVAIEKHLPKK